MRVFRGHRIKANVCELVNGQWVVSEEYTSYMLTHSSRFEKVYYEEKENAESGNPTHPI